MCAASYDDDELGYQRYLARQSAHFSQRCVAHSPSPSATISHSHPTTTTRPPGRLHYLTAAGFAAGIVLNLRAYDGAPRLTTVIQASVVLHEVFQARCLFPRDAASEIRSHAVKAKMHVFLHLAALAMILVSTLDGEGSTRNDSGAPLAWAMSVSLFLSLLSVADRLPLAHLTKLQIVKVVSSLLVGVVFFEAKVRLREAFVFIAIAGAAPCVVGAYAEYMSRISYVEKHHDASEAVLERFVDARPMVAWFVGGR